MSEEVVQWWVTLWVRGRRIQENIAGPYDDEDEARQEALRQVEIKPEGSTIALATSVLKPWKREEAK